MKQLTDENKRLLAVLKDRGFLLDYTFDPISYSLKLDLTPDGEHLARLIQKLYPSPDLVTRDDVMNLSTFFMSYRFPSDSEAGLFN
jgi:hypothetical protein